MSDGIIGLLEDGRRNERAQTRYYRGLAALAEEGGDEALVERFNDLHADEQHHLSRLTARLLELGASPEALAPGDASPSDLDGWEGEARTREEAEVRWYEEALKTEADPLTREIFAEILASEEKHAQELGGKWMSA